MIKPDNTDHNVMDGTLRTRIHEARGSNPLSSITLTSPVAPNAYLSRNSIRLPLPQFRHEFRDPAITNFNKNYNAGLLYFSPSTYIATMMPSSVESSAQRSCPSGGDSCQTNSPTQCS